MPGPDAAKRSLGRPVVLRPISLADIRLDAGTQIRAGVTEDVVSEYCERMLAGDVFPDVDVFFDGTAYYLADGFHRVLAAGRAKLSVIQCTVHPGSLAEALWFAIGANRKHGLLRSATDKHHAIELALTKFPEKTQEQVAQHVGCDRSYVSKVGNQLVNIHKLTLPAVRKGKDGRSRPTKYKARKQAKAEEAPPAIPVQLAVAQALPASTSPTSPTSSKRDFPTIVRTKFDKWMEQWAVADLPKVRKILWEVLKER
jgi:hypothetical protein